MITTERPSTKAITTSYITQANNISMVSIVMLLLVLLLLVCLFNFLVDMPVNHLVQTCSSRGSQLFGNNKSLQLH